MIELLEQIVNFEFFHLDAQTLILKDYLEIRPENEQRLRDLIAQGRSMIGPWFVQGDEVLVSGESNVRNLLYGEKLCKRFGAESMKVGYLPDQFGHIGQMPQILKGFGIESFVFGRGFDSHKRLLSEFVWEGSDGSRVLAVNMPYWYNNAQRFPDKLDEALRMIKMIKVLLLDLTLWMNWNAFRENTALFKCMEITC